MASPTTYRAELPDASRALNRGAVFVLGDGRAGSSPLNPIAAGIGMTLTAQGSASTIAVAGILRYEFDPDGTTFSSVSFVKSATQENTWVAEGAVGGLQLGFPERLDYDTPQPFTLVVTVTDQRGSTSESYTFWVGSAGDHAGQTSCLSRTTFSALLQNCCYNGKGFRQNEDLFGGFPGYDFFFPASYPWAVGIEYLTGGLLTKGCTPNRDLINPYIPDSISGVTSSPAQPDNPFTHPTVVVPTPNSPYSTVGAAQRIREEIDGAAAQFEMQVVPQATPPADPDGNVFAAVPGYETLSLASYPPPAPPFSRSTGAGRAVLSALFPDQPLADQTWIDRSTGGRIQLSLSGMQAGETIYFFASSTIADFGGEPTAAAGATGLEKWVSGPPLVFNRISTVGAVVSPLVSRLHAPTAAQGGLAANLAEFQPYSISGGSTWSQSILGGVGTIGLGTTTLSFAVPVDITALDILGVLKLLLHTEIQELPVYDAAWMIQGVVCRSGSSPTPTLTTGSFGVDWPQGAYLTNPVLVRMKD